MRPEMRVLFAHGKGQYDDGELAATADQLREALQAKCPNSRVVVLTAQAEFLLAAPSVGYAGWPGYVARALTQDGGSPRYHRLVVTSRRAGRITQHIVDQCLRAGKGVGYWDSGIARFRKVRGVVEVDRKDQKNGWYLVLEGE